VTVRARGALVVVLTAIACSGPGRLTREEFIGQANAICTDSNARIAAIAPPDPAEPELVADAVSQIVAVQRMALQDLADLRPPESIEQEVDEWLGLLGAVLDDEEQVATAVRDGDPAAADAANADAAATNTDAEAIATDLGLDSCTVAGTAPPLTPAPPDTGVPATDPAATTSGSSPLP
jgi:hypothetical protein